jgi:tetratricopeptide (TPR) repeat protein
MKTSLVLALLFCPLSGLADDVAGSAPEEPGTTIATKKAHPDLLRLEQELSRELDDKKDGRVTPEQYQAWKGEFRERLDAAITRVPPSPDNTAANARIMAQLGEGEAAHAALDQALEQNPKSQVLLTTKGQVLYDQKDFPGAAQNALQAWENSGHTDKGAWALYQMSKGRGAPSGAASTSPGLSPLKQGSPVVTADDSKKTIKLAVKGSALPSAVPVPGQDGSEPIKRNGGIPLWPLAVPFAGGLIAYGLYRGSKQTDAQETEQSPAGALLAAPGLVAGPAEVAGGVVRNVAKGLVVKTLGDIAVTGAVAAGILVAGGTAVIATVNHGLNEMIAAQDKYNAAIDMHRDDQQRSVRPTSIEDKSDLRAASRGQEPVWVVRAGVATPQQLKEGVDEHLGMPGLTGFSVQSAPGKTIEELAAAGGFPHGQISVTTVGALLAVGVPVVKSPGRGYHNTAKTEDPLTSPHAEAISAVFKQRPNPAQVKR